MRFYGYHKIVIHTIKILIVWIFNDTMIVYIIKPIEKNGLIRKQASICHYHFI